MREITYLEAVREAMTQEMERDEKVFMIGEDIGQYGGAFGASFGMLVYARVPPGFEGALAVGIGTVMAYRQPEKVLRAKWEAEK